MKTQNQIYEYLVYDMKDKELLVAIGNIYDIEKFTGTCRANICRAINNKRLVSHRYKVVKERLKGGKTNGKNTVI